MRASCRELGGTEHGAKGGATPRAQEAFRGTAKVARGLAAAQVYAHQRCPPS